MFCADYVAAFVYHAFFTIGSVNLIGKEVRKILIVLADYNDDHTSKETRITVIIM